MPRTLRALRKSKQNYDAERRAMGSNLLRFASILEEMGVCDAGPIKSAANDCLANSSRSKDRWGYSLDNLEFIVDTPRNTLPKSIGKQLRLSISLKIVCKCDDRSHDPFENLELNIELYDSRPPLGEAYISWHLDRHKSESSTEISDELHPLFHMQHGGDKTHSYLAGELGKILLVSPPRLPYPPMDAILAIDFVIANFMGRAWRSLRDMAEYNHLILGSQYKFWLPYMTLLGSAFDDDVRGESNPVFSIWPSLAIRASGHEKLIGSDRR